MQTPPNFICSSAKCHSVVLKTLPLQRHSESFFNDIVSLKPCKSRLQMAHQKSDWNLTHTYQNQNILMMKLV